MSLVFFEVKLHSVGLKIPGSGREKGRGGYISDLWCFDTLKWLGLEHRLVHQPLKWSQIGTIDENFAESVRICYKQRKRCLSPGMNFNSKVYLDQWILLDLHWPTWPTTLPFHFDSRQRLLKSRAMFASLFFLLVIVLRQNHLSCVFGIQFQQFSIQTGM